MSSPLDPPDGGEPSTHPPDEPKNPRYEDPVIVARVHRAMMVCIKPV